MANLGELTQLLSDSIYTPEYLSDPAYQKIQDRIGGIIEQSCKDTGYLIEELPPALEHYVILLSLKQLFRSLSVMFAPEYNIESEFTKISMGDRFTHYFRLTEEVQKEIDGMISRGETSVVTSSDIIISGRDGGRRNYNLSINQKGTISNSNITSTSADLDWSVFDISIGRFAGYEVFIGTEVLYDPYEEVPLAREKSLQTFFFSDLKRNKFRIKNLESNTSYNVVILYRGADGSQSAFLTTFTTLETEVVP